MRFIVICKVYLNFSCYNLFVHIILQYICFIILYNINKSNKIKSILFVSLLFYVKFIHTQTNAYKNNKNFMKKVYYMSYIFNIYH